jgi:CRP-like cAMP-binding protein
MTTDSGAIADEQDVQQSLGTAAAKNLATTTKTPPQMQGITSRWLLRVLPWVEVSGGTYRVNRRLSHAVGRGRVSFVQTGDDVRLVPQTLAEIPLLRDLEDQGLLDAIAQQFVQREVAAGEVLVEAGRPIEQVLLIAHGKITRRGSGKYGGDTVLGVLSDGDHFGDDVLSDPASVWEYTATAATPTTVLALDSSAFAALTERSATLRGRISAYLETLGREQDKHGQAEIGMSAGHEGEYELPGAFVDYELNPREYELSVAQTVLRVHSRVADLYNQPMNQIEHQLKLTVQALRERQEFEMVNNKEFGLLHNADYSQRISTHSGPPTPDDLDELLSRRRSTKFIFAHPRAIAAFGRECNKRGLYPSAVTINDHSLPAWRGVPILPCGKIPVDAAGTSSIIAVRTGEDDQGVVGLHQTGIPDEIEPGLNVRFMGINEKAVISYLVSAYYSAAVLVPDALGILENVEVHQHD